MEASSQLVPLRSPAAQLCCGADPSDTRVLLCDTQLGEVWALTDRHHAEARVEADRLRRMGTDRLISDSFGESRWMGAIENTRRCVHFFISILTSSRTC